MSSATIWPSARPAVFGEFRSGAVAGGEFVDVRGNDGVDRAGSVDDEFEQRLRAVGVMR